MVVGHYAAALLPVAHRVKGPFWLFLLCSQVPEFLWLILAVLGIEPTLPSSILDAALSNIQVDMKYSHNLVPALIQAFLTGVFVFAFFKDKRLTVWCGGLVILHVLCDYLVGFAHQVMWYESASIGLNSYTHMPYMAVIIELVFALSIILYLQKNRKGESGFTQRKFNSLYIVFTVGVLLLLPSARITLREWFGFL